MSSENSDNANTTVEYLLRPVPSINESTNCIKVLELFHKNKKLYVLPVVNDKDRPVGLIVRQELTKFFSKPYMKELKGKKPISMLMDEAPIILDRNTEIEDAARIVLDAGIQHMISGFIITKEKHYFGMANGYDLFNEITIRKQEHLFSLAHFDQLSGLPNRTLLLDRLSQAISLSNRDLRKVSLLFIDLDEFKPVNDTYDHVMGDRLLKEVRHVCLPASDREIRLPVWVMTSLL